MLRALLFDFNGVLVDDEPIHHALIRQVLEEQGIALDLPRPQEMFLGREDRACFDMALDRAGRTADPVELTRLVARKRQYYRHWVRREGYPFFPGALQLAGEAAAHGLMLGVVTGASRDEVESALEQAGVRELFKILVTTEDVPRGKPDPRGYLLALERLNSRPPLPDRLLHPHEVLAIEDSVPGLAAAQDAGLVTLAVCHSHPAERLRFADAVRPDLEVLNVPCLQAIYAEVSER